MKYNWAGGKSGKDKPVPSGSSQSKEEEWDAVSPSISALLQGRGNTVIYRLTDKWWIDI